MLTFLKEAAHVVPSQRQQTWFDMEFYGFIHFGVNTFTDREWGDGTEDPAIFNPVDLDCDQWVAALKSAGMTGMVLTAKHHDGFCLWPSKYTEHSVKNSPISRDIVREAAEACKRGGIKFGFYLSPWDRNNPLYGTDAYNDYFCNQLTELLTEYGDIFYVWFDNACGEGPNGKKQQYDFPRYISLIRKYQPNAVIFNDHGPDIRWCGNEAGVPKNAEWAVVPSELCFYADVQTGAGPLAETGSLSFIKNSQQNLGCMDNILYSKGLVFTPSEFDTSIRPGWFWHASQIPHSLQKLFRIYLTSVGSNACLHLNVPPNNKGLIDAQDVQRLQELGDLIRKEFSHPYTCSHTLQDSACPTQPCYEITFAEPPKELRYVVLEEDILQGQRVESFQIEAVDDLQNTFVLYQGTTIGRKKICTLEDPYQDQNPLTRVLPTGTQKLLVRITSARDQVCLKSVTAY